MTVQEINLPVYAPLVKGTVVQTINVLAFLFMISVVDPQIAFSGPIAILGDAYQH